MESTHSRRRFIKKYLLTSPAFLGVVISLSSCSGKKSGDRANDKSAKVVGECDDFSGLSENDLKAREKLAYVNDSPIPDMTCSKCNLFLPPGGDKKCGGCMLFKGPVYASGYCTYFTAKQG